MKVIIPENWFQYDENEKIIKVFETGEKQLTEEEERERGKLYGRIYYWHKTKGLPIEEAKIKAFGKEKITKMFEDKKDVKAVYNQRYRDKKTIQEPDPEKVKLYKQKNLEAVRKYQQKKKEKLENSKL